MTSADTFAVRRPLSEASHAPGALYSAPEFYRLDVERLFMRDWLYAGRVEELARPGDYLTMRIAGEPIVIARTHTGELGAFYNMCVHRGVEVAEGCGNTRAFKCPYHGWIYDLSGRLTGAAYMKESAGFDADDARMRPLRLETWRKNIFVTFDPAARPLHEFIAEFDKDFGFLRMEDCRLGNRIVLDLACNWKFVHENLMDFYHVGVLHAKTFGAKFAWTDDNVHLKPGGGLSIFYAAGPPTPGAEPLLGKMPWMQLAMASPAYRPGRMSTLEKPLHHYLNGYLDRVLGEGDAARARDV